MKTDGVQRDVETTTRLLSAVTVMALLTQADDTIMFQTSTVCHEATNLQPKKKSVLPGQKKNITINDGKELGRDTEL